VRLARVVGVNMVLCAEGVQVDDVNGCGSVDRERIEINGVCVRDSACAWTWGSRARAYITCACAFFDYA
jgi:hypothetical protein